MKQKVKQGGGSKWLQPCKYLNYGGGGGSGLQKKIPWTLQGPWFLEITLGVAAMADSRSRKGVQSSKERPKANLAFQTCCQYYQMRDLNGSIRVHFAGLAKAKIQNSCFVDINLLMFFC